VCVCVCRWIGGFVGKYMSLAVAYLGRAPNKALLWKHGSAVNYPYWYNVRALTRNKALLSKFDMEKIPVCFIHSSGVLKFYSKRWFEQMVKRNGKSKVYQMPHGQNNVKSTHWFPFYLARSTLDVTEKVEECVCVCLCVCVCVCVFVLSA
jgi:hypothetical protein